MNKKINTGITTNFSNGANTKLTTDIIAYFRNCVFTINITSYFNNDAIDKSITEIIGDLIRI